MGGLTVQRACGVYCAFHRVYTEPTCWVSHHCKPEKNSRKHIQITCNHAALCNKAWQELIFTANTEQDAEQVSCVVFFCALFHSFKSRTTHTWVPQWMVSFFFNNKSLHHCFWVFRVLYTDLEKVTSYQSQAFFLPQCYCTCECVHVCIHPFLLSLS